MKQSDWPGIGDFTVLYFKNLKNTDAYLQYIFFYFRFIFVI